MMLRHLKALPVVLLAASAAACAVQADDTSVQEDDLTSVTARTRSLKFAGYVYVRDGASDSEILSAVRRQTQSAFGAMRTSDIGVQSREFKDVDPQTFVKTKVKVVDTTKANDAGTTMLKVSYTFTDTALVPKTMSTSTSISMGLLNGYYQSQSDRILKECTNGDAHAHEFQSSIWYVFEPRLSSCKTAMAAEQKLIDADKGKLKDATSIPLSEVNRLYIPATGALKATSTSSGTKYPEYDRLFSGGVQKDKVVIGMVNGLMADWAAGEKHDTIDDEGYGMWFEGMREIFQARPGFKMTKIEPQEDLTTFSVGGKSIKLAGGIDDVMKMELDGTFPQTATDHRALRVAAANKLLKHWVTFQVPVSVTMGGQTKTVTIELNTYFGAETDPTPYKRAVKGSDIMVYNGHSYIGYGPLDPSNFSASDFPQSYQIIVVNGCISFNYYDHYFGLKSGGTKNLDTITNGLESWVGGSGPAMGRLVGAMIDGKMNSYATILKAGQFDYYAYGWGNDALRVVDGEVDNVYKPSKTPITLK